MTTKQPLAMTETFIKFSKTLGRRADYTQGGGGNTSCKITNELLTIKASGCLLQDIEMHSGHVTVNIAPIREFLADQPNDENQACTFLQQQINDSFSHNGLRPSIETGFHVLLTPQWVGHTHSVYANILNCAQNAHEIVTQNFPQALFVPYARPGLLLTLSLQNALQEKISDVVFMQNHGLIVAGDCADTVLERQEHITSQIKQLLDLKAYPQPSVAIKNGQICGNTPFVQKSLQKYSFQYLQEHVLFPDQVVYFASNKLSIEDSVIIYHTKMNEALAIEQTLTAYFFILESLYNNQLTPNFLSCTDIQQLQDMESEKYRQMVIAS